MIVFDIETDGLLDIVTKIHCLSYFNWNTLEYGSITDYNEIIDLVTNQDILIGHNIIRYDVPVLEKILDIKITATCYDTLAISWYLDPRRKRHGLEAWGEVFGVEKPKIDDWENLSIEDYIHRCEEDVKINSKLWEKQEQYLNLLYDGQINRIIGYLSFKMECLRDQEEEGITLDIALCEETMYNLEYIIQEKIMKLANYMPQVVVKTPPKIMYKKDKSLSVHGANWFQLLKQKDLPEDSTCIYEKGNPGSTKQLKEWLLGLGWNPITFKVSKSTGEKVSQVSLPFGQGLCPSVKALYEKLPILVELEGLYVAQHRFGVLKSMIENQRDGRIYATAHGFTNTLRMAHSKPLVNLPGVFKPYGKEIRGCMIIPNDKYVMCGSDVSGLEDATKMHYMYFFDPEYVKKMQVPGFDPHLDIGVFASLITEDEVEFFKNFNKETASEGDKHLHHSIKQKRASAKTVNFGGIYGIGPPKLAEQLDIPLKEAQNLHTAYWNRNGAVKKVVKAVKVQVFNNQKWLFNPVSKFWYFLKADKDKFSTLNQGKICPV